MTIVTRKKNHENRGFNQKYDMFSKSKSKLFQKTTGLHNKKKMQSGNFINSRNLKINGQNGNGFMDKSF